MQHRCIPILYIPTLPRDGAFVMNFLMMLLFILDLGSWHAHQRLRGEK
jgi:hypothetical protein